ncbi:unnamed protein product [Clavelina lepadiformis]|uniref:Amino acid transporter transmembrane domain-containing protein n=2 Tax=Clavelina lepadiformis TaxID=159417 RepID=A0ABP0GH59_CLALP
MYSPTVGVIYVFNLIVGTGALTLPRAMAAAGWLVSIVLLIFLGIISYITTTFMVECLSIANACKRHEKKELMDEGSDPPTPESIPENASIIKGGLIEFPRSGIASEHSPLLDSTSSTSSRRSSNGAQQKFAITQAVEMGEMADMFFNKIGRTLFYLCITIYLYGDLAIYAAAVPKSLRDIVCGNLSCSASNASGSQHVSDDDICWGSSITRMDVYRIFLAIFAVTLGPFTYFSVQKTKYLQITTTLFRWIAFILMIVLAIIHISKTNGGEGRPPIAEVSGIPNLFGVSVYSFMCQHSLPSLVTPIRNKRSLSKLLAADYMLILIFYMLLGMTAIYCFQSDVLQDIYTLNFQDSCDTTNVAFLRYFLGLFPVFTLSTNFPIIAVTLRNNLQSLFKKTSSFYINRILYPTLAIAPPIGVAFATNNLTILVGVTGSYAGAGVQYVIPAFLVLLARKEAVRLYGRVTSVRNEHRSPFARRLWVILVFIWAAVCLIFVTTNHILTWTSGGKN